MNNKKYLRKTVPFIMSWFIFAGWGSVGHKIINPNSVNSFPETFKQFSFWKDSLANHSSDPDKRISSANPTEAPKHYIDLEDFDDFVTKGTVIQNYDSAVTKYGLYAITDAGSLPWTIVQCYDTLVNAFQQKDWHHAVILSADLGHYIGDGNMPLHLTKNYNGQLTGQTGIHSRYESNMISKFSTLLPIQQKEAIYLSDVQDFIFTMVYQNYHYVDSVLRADSIAYATAKSSSSDLYYSTLWNLTKNFTGKLFSNASEILASIMYTAWVNAGSPPLLPTFVEELNPSLKSFSLAQNYPNPFNPSTVISYQLSVSSNVNLKIFDILGTEIATLVNEEQHAGNHSVNFDITNKNMFKSNTLPSGNYFYQLRAGNVIQAKKMMYLK